MKNLLIVIAGLFMLTSCSSQKKTYELSNGKKITQKKFSRLYKRVFMKSFGKMTKDQKKLFDGVEIYIDTSSQN